MPAKLNPHLETLFCKAIAISDAAGRELFLDGACGKDEKLRTQVARMVADHFRAGGFLNLQAPVLSETMALPTLEKAGSRIGNYKLLEQIGEGGMGTVWMADQVQPVQRRVALKLIRVDCGSSQMILSRFEAERQAIALMDHPHIARLLDAGATADGSPYFVMELVKGLPLSEFCDAHCLSVVDRLHLFQQICSAVQHAHQKGIIHRDLKPSNILVESHDGKPVPKIIDFGIAKATSAMKLSENTLFTGFGNVLGTPLYMAPEQANFNALDIDTRADVYALGVILYELLTGSTPLTKETIKDAALDQIVKMIREHEAQTPSSRISSSEGKPAIAASRFSEPERLSRFVKGELDWIVMKALSKERERRYESASSFGRDIERFLSHEPVQAGPPSSAYRIRKFIRRNRLQVSAGAIVIMALLAGVIGTTLGLLEVKRQYQVAIAESAAKETALQSESRQRALAEQSEAKAIAAVEAERIAREQSDKRRAQIEKGVELFANMLTGINPRNEELGGPTLYQQLLEKAEKAAVELEGHAVGDAVSVARLQTILGQTLTELGNPKIAVNILEKAVVTRKSLLGADHADTLTSLHELALAYQEAGMQGESLRVFEQTLSARKLQLGSDHSDTISTMGGLARAYQNQGRLDEAVILLEAALLAIKEKLGPGHNDVLSSMHRLGVAYRLVGRLEEGVVLLEQTMEARKNILGADHYRTLQTMTSLANVYSEAGRNDEALQLEERALAATKSKLGAEHPATFVCMNNLAGTYMQAGKFEKSVALMEELMTLSQTKRGVDHPATIEAIANLGFAYVQAGQLDRALPLIEQALAAKKLKFPADHPSIFTSISQLGSYYERAGKHALALPLFEQLFAAQKEKLGADHAETLGTMDNLANAYQQAGDLHMATAISEQTLATRKAKLGLDHPHTLRSMNNLAGKYMSLSKFDRALEMHQECFEAQKIKLGPEHPDTLMSMANICRAYRRAGKPDHVFCERAYAKIQAELGDAHYLTLGTMNELALAYADADKLDKALPLLKKRWGESSAEYVSTLHNLGIDCLNRKRWTDAEFLFRECLDVQTKADPDDVMTFISHKTLGTALLAQKKFAEAEPFLLKGYVGLEKRLALVDASQHCPLKETLEYLVGLYSGWHGAEANNGYDANAAEWRNKRDAYDATVAAIIPPAGDKLNEALPRFEQLFAERKEKLGADHPDTLRSMSTLAMAYQAAGKLNQALILFEDVLATSKAKLSPDHMDTVARLNCKMYCRRTCGYPG